MSETREILCDACGSGLTTSGNCEDYRIVLASQGIPSWGGAVTAMAIPNPVPTPLHFCNWRCLETWWETRMESASSRQSEAEEA